MLRVAVQFEKVEALGALPREYGQIRFVVETGVPRYSSSLDTSAEARTKSQGGFRISEALGSCSVPFLCFDAEENVTLKRKPLLFTGARLHGG